MEIANEKSVVFVVPTYVPSRENFEKNSGVLVDRFGWEYYDRLPEGFRLATIDDFHSNGRRLTGMLFLIRWADREDYYQVCRVSGNLTRELITPFINDNRVFIQS